MTSQQTPGYMWRRNRLIVVLAGTPTVGKTRTVNLLAGEAVALESPVPIDGARPFVVELVGEKMALFIVELPGIDGADVRRLRSAFETIRVVKRGRFYGIDGAFIRSTDIRIGGGYRRSPRRRRMILAFVVDLLSGFKRDDARFLVSLAETFPRLAMIIVVRKADLLLEGDCKEAVDALFDRLQVLGFGRAAICRDEVELSRTIRSALCSGSREWARFKKRIRRTQLDRLIP